MTTYQAGSCDVAVIGAGHAGIEAALAAARLGLRTILFTINLDAVANLPCNPAIPGQDLHDLGLLQFQPFLLLQGMLHILLVLAAVRLGPEGMDRGTLAPVQHPVLDAAMVRSQTHLAAQGIQFPDQMALAGAADGRITGHIAHGIQIDGKEDGVHTKPGGRQGGFDARMACADDGNITGSSVVIHTIPPIVEFCNAKFKMHNAK